MNNRIDEIKERLNSATPWPWESVILNEGLWNECMGVRGSNPYRNNEIETFAQNQWFCHSAEDEDKATESCYANMRLMGHAPSDTAYLLAQVEAMEEVVGASRNMLRGIDHHNGEVQATAELEIKRALANLDSLKKGKK